MVMEANLPSNEIPLDYLGFFGLDQDPFSAPFFYGGANRQVLLEQLNHQCQFGAGIVAVLGASGVGKTTLCRNLLSSISEGQRCYIAAELMTSCSQILVDIARTFDLPSEGGTSGQILSEIRHFSQSAEEESRVVIAIDNAQNLDDETLVALLSLLQGQEASLRYLHLVLLGSEDLINRLDAIEVSDVLIQDFYLDPLTSQELEDYLSFRICEAGFIEGMHSTPFTPAYCAKLNESLQGNLNKIHDQARLGLMEAALPKPVKRAIRLPLGHITAVLALATLLLVAVYFPDDEPGELRQESAGVTVKPLVLPVQKTHVSPGDPEGGGASAGIRIEGRETENKLGFDSSSLLPKPKPEIAAQITEKVSKPSVEPITADIPAVIASKTKKVLVSNAKPEPKPLGSVKVSTSRLNRDELAVMSWSANEFTLQVSASHSKSNIRDFVSRQSNRAQLKIITTRRDGSDWHVVFAGRYRNAAEASRAKSSLPRAQQNAGPWARSAKSVQLQLREYHGIN